MKIGLIAFDDFTDLDLILRWDLLNRVRLYNLHPNWEVKILGTEAHHRSVSGLIIPTSAPIEYAEECDAVLVTSGIGTRKLLKDESFLKRLKLEPQRQLIAAQCCCAISQSGTTRFHVSGTTSERRLGLTLLRV